MNSSKKTTFLGMVLMFATLVNSAHADITSIAGDFTEARQKAWVALAKSMTQAANAETGSMDVYLNGLLGACEGVTGKVMEMHAPNAVAMQILGFCMAVKDIQTEKKFHEDGNKHSMFSGAPAYCGDFNQGLRHFESMPNTPDYALIYPAAQELAAAAKKIKATEFTFVPIYNGPATIMGIDMRPKPVIEKCN